AMGLLFVSRPSAGDQTVVACDQESLQQALDGVEPDGIVNFSCDGTIVLTNTITITQNVVIDGSSHNIIISGGTNQVRLFTLTLPEDAAEDDTVTLTLLNVMLADGVSTNGGAVFVNTNTTLIVTNCVFSNNVALATNALAGVSARTNSTAIIGADGHN